MNSLHAPTQRDLFSNGDPLVGLRVRLDRDIDHRQPCHENIVELCAGPGPHAYGLLCAACGRHRGWLPKTAATFIAEAIRVHGVPREPLIYRDQSSAAVAGADGGSNASAPQEEQIMLMTKYAGSRFIDLDDVSEGPFKQEIVEVVLGQYDKPVLKFKSGLQFSVNVTNCGTLIEAFGEDSDSWLGETIELYKGQLKFKGEPKDGVLVRPITRPAGVEKRKVVPKKPKHGDMDDEITL